ncbi:MAG: hypothetical protein ACRD6R_00875 [Candidatus Polarisedimenticolia bacterium]
MSAPRGGFGRSRFAAAALGLLVLLCAGRTTLTAADFGVRGGPYTDSEEPFVGAELLFNLDNENRWYGNPNAEYVFVENGGLATVSFDFHYDLAAGGRAAVWAGAGPTLILVDRDRPGNDDDVDAGANLLFGVGAREGEVRPYGQVKLILADDSQAVLAFGIRF